MIIIDTNIILRYLLNDNKDLSTKAVEIVDNNDIFIPTEVIVEVCYVLSKVYSIERDVIYKVIHDFSNMENINFQNINIVKTAFKLYAERKLDIVDCLLYAYNKVEKYNVETFDTKLMNLIKNNK